MKEFTTLAVDGIGKWSGEPETMYLRKLAGVWHWYFDAPKSCGQEVPDVIPFGYQAWLTNPTEPYKVKIQYTPEILNIERIS